MTFREYLTEMGDSVYKYTRTHTRLKDTDAYKFHEGDDEYEVFIMQGQIKYPDKNDNRDIIRVDFNKNGSGDTSKSKHPFKIFSTVHDILKKYNPKRFDTIEIVGKSSDKSRIKLYRKFAEFLRKELNFKEVNEREMESGFSEIPTLTYFHINKTKRPKSF